MNNMPLRKSPVPRTEQETLIIFGAMIVGLGIVMALIDTCTTRRDDPAQGDNPDDTTTRGFWADVRYFLLACVWWTAFLPFGAMVGLLAMVLITAADSYIPHEDERDVEAGPDTAETSGDSPPPPAYSVSPIIVTEETQLVSETSPPPSYQGVGAPVI